MSFDAMALICFARVWRRRLPRWWALLAAVVLLGAGLVDPAHALPSPPDNTVYGNSGKIGRASCRERV